MSEEETQKGLAEDTMNEHIVSFFKTDNKKSNYDNKQYIDRKSYPHSEVNSSIIKNLHTSLKSRTKKNNENKNIFNKNNIFHERSSTLKDSQNEKKDLTPIEISKNKKKVEKAKKKIKRILNKKFKIKKEKSKNKQFKQNYFPSKKDPITLLDHSKLLHSYSHKISSNDSCGSKKQFPLQQSKSKFFLLSKNQKDIKLQESQSPDKSAKKISLDKFIQNKKKKKSQTRISLYFPYFKSNNKLSYSSQHGKNLKMQPKQPFKLGKKFL